MQSILKEHIFWLGYPDIPIEAPLVLSRNYRHTSDGRIELKPLSRKRLWTVISFAAQELGIRDELGTHSLRKTYVWQAWARGESPPVTPAIRRHAVFLFAMLNLRWLPKALRRYFGRCYVWAKDILRGGA